jgi:hypothetical protein
MCRSILHDEPHTPGANGLSNKAVESQRLIAASSRLVGTVVSITLIVHETEEVVII